MQESEDPNVQKNASRLKLGPSIGRGGFGEVRFAHWHGQPYAIKIFFLSKSDAAQKDIKKEIQIMSKLRHRHIVLFHRGAIVQERLAFIMEYAENGSLQRVIRSKISLEWTLKEKITQGIVRGLAHIHSAGVIHRDLKSGNVLLTKHMEPKLCDFGLATVKDHSTTKAGEETLKGSVRWMAPELFIGKPLYNTKIDMYALGWIMWELATDTTPPFWEQPADAVVISLVKEGERLPIPSDTPSDYQRWIQRCWDQNPTNRPAADEMVTEEPEPEGICEGEVSLGSFSTSRVAMLQSESESQAASIPSSSKLSSSASLTAAPTSIILADDAESSQLAAPFQDLDLEEIDDYHEKDNKDALFAMGEMHKKSAGAVQDDLKALVCFFRAAEHGHPEAQFRIAKMYEAGQPIPVPRDVDRARRWLEQAVDHGHAQAKESLNAMLDQAQPVTSSSDPQIGSSAYTPEVAPANHLPDPRTFDPTNSRASPAEQFPLVISGQIGAGGYSRVYQGRWGTRQVAIKKFHLQQSEAYIGAVQHEIQTLERLRHRHIIQFYGTTYEDGHLALIMDIAEGGSLRLAIEAQKLDWSAKARITQEIVRGLAYIHEVGILHRDLKSSNVLLTRHFEVRLADFALATVKQLMSDTVMSGALKGTLRWMAPELLSAKPIYSTKSDMFALGMVMWEMAANCTVPFKDETNNFSVISIVRGGGREVLPEDTPAEYRHWTEQCWDQDPASRPEAADMISYDDFEHAYAGKDLPPPTVTITLTDYEIDLLDLPLDPSLHGPESPLSRSATNLA
ncbi:hypothetical protein DFQ27_000340 [Actinomortierella ambigua]|uniref:Protein kinase domain-containing protein n=1 Tax=Actinomortierella ambigua TaxID=1343610 RepID=A0A9P6QF79_9FUNG|nr:hypothetical protein DFQ27_000340 [Actinomortierella ambigua]